jgi:hypothetical protein
MSRTEVAGGGKMDMNVYGQYNFSVSVAMFEILKQKEVNVQLHASVVLSTVPTGGPQNRP